MKHRRATNPPPADADLKRLQYQMEIHQVELEAQNQSLVEAQVKTQAALAHHTQLYDFAPVGYLSLQPDGELRQLNFAAATLLGAERSRLVSQRLRQFVGPADRAALADFLDRVFGGQNQACEVTLAEGVAPPRVVRLEAVSTPSGQECQVVMTDITERKRADEALRAETTRRRILFEQLPDGIMVIDSQTARFVEFNAAAHQQLGYSREEFARLTLHDLEASETYAETKAHIAEAKQTGSVDFETLHRTRQGEIRHVHVTSKLVNVQGQAVHQCVLRDITLRKKMAAALGQKTSVLRERVKELECLYEMAGLVAKSGQVPAELFQAAVGLIPPAWSYPAITGARIAIGEEQFMTDNFKQTPWRLSAYLVASGEKLGSVEVCYLEERPARDEGPFLKEERTLLDNLAGMISVTVERERSKIVLQKSEEKLRELTERHDLAVRAGEVGVWDYDVANGRLIWDDQMFQLYGITREQFSGAYEAWQAGLHPEDRQRGSEEVGMALRGEKEFNTEFRVLWPDGSIHHLRARATVYRDASGQSVRILGTNWDITYAKRVAEQLQQTNAELTAKERALEAEVEVRRAAEQRVRHLNDQLALRVTELGAVNAELKSFSYTVSHDLRAPLRQVVGFAHSLQKAAGDRLDPRAAEYIPLIQGSATRMGQLIDAMIEFSGLGRTTVHFGPVQLQSLAEQACQVLEPAIAGRIVHWKIGPLPEVQGDAALLRQVLMNLLDNALKFTRPRAAAEIAVGCAITPHECIVSVADNGVGFDDQHAEQLFGVFQRLHGRAEFEGTGIGLASVRRIIQRHGGRTWAESRLGHGTTVFFTLPADPTAPAPAAMPVLTR